MPSASESRQVLQLLTAEAVITSLDLLNRVQGSPEVQRAALLEGVPAVVSYYAEGSAALAADFYDEERELAGVRTRFTPDLVVVDRAVKLRTAVAWSAAPLFADDVLQAAGRLAEVVQLDVARAFRDTITGNRRADPQAVGWRRITVGGCKFCRMLADRGAVYKQETALFAAHTNCHCTAQPVFTTNYTGVEASVMQYRASRHNRTPKQRAELRAFLAANY